MKKIYLLIFLGGFCLVIKAQVVDTLKSEQVFKMLTACNYTKTLIDGRDSAMFYSGHIQNAVYIDAFSEQLTRFLEDYTDCDTLVVYCTNQTRSEMIIDKLIKLNYQGRILYMQDGITGWKNNGYAIEIPEINKKADMVKPQTRTTSP